MRLISSNPIQLLCWELHSYACPSQTATLQLSVSWGLLLPWLWEEPIVPIDLHLRYGLRGWTANHILSGYLVHWSHPRLDDSWLNLLHTTWSIGMLKNQWQTPILPFVEKLRGQFGTWLIIIYLLVVERGEPSVNQPVRGWGHSSNSVKIWIIPTCCYFDLAHLLHTHAFWSFSTPLWPVIEKWSHFMKKSSQRPTKSNPFSDRRIPIFAG